jgi:hypothetical protein
MATQQGDVALLNDPIAQELLQSNNMAHLAYNWTDGTPRVVPIWFHWDGTSIVVGSPPGAPKLKVLQTGSKVAVAIDEKTWPVRALYVRGSVTVDWVDGVAEEYALAAKRYMGEEMGSGWVAQVGTLVDRMARVAVKPEWVGLMHIETRPPSAIEKAMAGSG